MIELGMLLLVGFAVFIFLMIAAVVKLCLWVVLLPLRLLFWTVGGLLLLPFLLLKFVLGGILLLLTLPVIVVGAAIALVVGAMVALLPLLPFVLLFALLWYLLRDPSGALAGSR